jgi:hypothetical protein
MRQLVRTGALCLRNVFPTNVRYSGLALAYTGANLVADGPMPVLAVWLFALCNGSP